MRPGRAFKPPTNIDNSNDYDIKYNESGRSSRHRTPVVNTPSTVNRLTPHVNSDAKSRSTNKSHDESSGTPHPRGQLTLGDQEKVIDKVRKENFSLKLKIYFLEERLNKLAPEQVEAAVKENVELRADLQSVKQDLKKHKKMVAEFDKNGGTARQDGASGRTAADLEREIERLKEERELERLQLEDKGAEGMEDMEEELNMYRDKLSTVLLDVEKLEKEREELVQELEACDADIEGWKNNYEQVKQDLEVCENDNEEWRNNYEQLKNEKDEVADLLELRNAELLDAQDKLAEMEGYMNEDQEKIDELSRLLRTKDSELENKQEEIRTQAEDIKKLGEEIVDLEVNAKHRGKSEAERDTVLEELSKLKRNHANCQTERESSASSLEERNNLLLLIQSYLENVLSNTKSPRKRSIAMEMKSLNDFPIFSDALMTKLKDLGNLIPRFEQQISDVENKFSKQMAMLRKSYEGKSRQLDRLETSMKSASESHRQWRSRVVMKQSELDTVRATNSELLTQISSLKSRASSAGGEPGSATKVSHLHAKLSATERRLVATQKQLDDAQEKLVEAQDKVNAAEEKWLSKFRELEEEVKNSRSKAKRERKSANERVNELLHEKNHLEDQIAEGKKRNKELSTHYEKPK